MIKHNTARHPTAFLLGFWLAVLYLVVATAEADQRPTVPADGVVKAISAVDQVGGLSCTLNRVQSQCSSLDRCHQTLDHLKQAVSRNHQKIWELEKFRAAKRSQDRCVQALMGDYAAPLITSLQEHARIMERLAQHRANN